MSSDRLHSPCLPGAELTEPIVTELLWKERNEEKKMASQRSIAEAQRIVSEAGLDGTKLVEYIADSLDKAFAEGVEMHRYVELIKSASKVPNHPPPLKLDKRGRNG